MFFRWKRRQIKQNYKFFNFLRKSALSQKLIKKEVMKNAKK